MIFNQNMKDEELSDETEISELSVTVSNLPSSIIATNLSYQIFDDDHEREIFESHFEDIDDAATFHYFKSFRRVRINFSTPEQASEARMRMHLRDYKGYTIKCYFTQPIFIGNSSHLEPPKREKQFLISPPASPPVGWEPMPEAEPLINYDLLNAVAALAPGEPHELHPPSKDQPGIVVHICEEGAHGNASGVRLPQTRCPDRKSF
ncbi:Calcipressin-1 [Armadillidium nasatum]|uniref:Calcipressin-1 n=1 Tax=Armadillidium nasatum TaxID=96803 RepID=A0A5N5TK37_9CRUS|nr:Calcipressin-1 [Armadillidium nasatum]